MFTEIHDISKYLKALLIKNDRNKPFRVKSIFSFRPDCIWSNNFTVAKIQRALRFGHCILDDTTPFRYITRTREFKKHGTLRIWTKEGKKDDETIMSDSYEIEETRIRTKWRWSTLIIFPYNTTKDWKKFIPLFERFPGAKGRDWLTSQAVTSRIVYKVSPQCQRSFEAKWFQRNKVTFPSSLNRTVIFTTRDVFTQMCPPVKHLLQLKEFITLYSALIASSESLFLKHKLLLVFNTIVL